MLALPIIHWGVSCCCPDSTWRINQDFFYEVVKSVSSKAILLQTLNRQWSLFGFYLPINVLHLDDLVFTIVVQASSGHSEQQLISTVYLGRVTVG